jgi:hypothetical protein
MQYSILGSHRSFPEARTAKVFIIFWENNYFSNVTQFLWHNQRKGLELGRTPLLLSPFESYKAPLN